MAQKIVKLIEKQVNVNYAYPLEMGIKDKIKAVAMRIYGATNVEYEEMAEQKIKQIEKLGYGHLPICIAKTQYSFSDDPKMLGKIMTMPGLPKIPAAEQIGLDEDGNIVGIF